MTPAKRLHPEKKGIRILGIAESFSSRSPNSSLAGIVIRRDGFVDGVVYGHCTVEGDDATQAILEMNRLLDRQDINCIMIDGLIISMYNIIDGDAISQTTGLPVLAVTFEDETTGLENIIKGRFGQNTRKLESYHKLGVRERVRLWTDKEVFIRYWGLCGKTALALLNSFTVQGSIPEPIRLAKIAARAVSRML